MRFIRSAGTTVVFKGLSLAFGLGISVLIGRELGAEGRGVYGLVMTIIVLASSFGVFGFHSSNTYFVARDKSSARIVGIQSIIVGLAGCVITAAILLGLWWWTPSVLQGMTGSVLLVTIVLLPIYLWGNLFSRAYLGLGDIVAFNSFETLGRAVFFGAGLVIILWHGMSFELFLQVVAGLLAVFILYYIYRYFHRAPSGESRLGGLVSKSLSYGMRSYVATIFTWAMIRSGIFFVNYFNGTAEAGLFSVAQQLSELLIIIPTVVAAVLFPRVAGGNSQDLTARVLRTMAAVFLPVFILMAVFAEPLIVLLYGQEFVPSATVLLILLPGAFLLGLEVIAAGDIAGRGYPWLAALIWIPLFGINVAGYVMLIPRLGINGAAVSTSLSYVLAFVFMAAYLKKLSGFSLSQMFVPKQADLKTVVETIKQTLRGEK